MEEHKLNKKFLKYCPGCKAYLPNVWKECPTCKKGLRNLFLQYYAVGLSKKAIGVFKKALPLIIILSLCVYGTYGIQKNERMQYKHGYNLLIKKEFRAGWEEIKDALAKNPLYKYVQSLIGGAKDNVKSTVSEIKKEHYALRDIYFDINGKKNSALINNKVVFEGDSMDGFKVTKVNMDSIDIETEGKQENIKFGRTWN